MKKVYLFAAVCLLCSAVISAGVQTAGKDDKKPSVKQTDECYKCHKENGNLPKDYNENDVHIKLSCASCHGGDAKNPDMSEAMDPSKGFKGSPSISEIPEFCGKCHSNITYMRTYQPRISTDQVAQYSKSMHGQKLKTGDKNVAQCVSCHNAHDILPVKDPRSSVYKNNVPSMCNKCHGSESLMKGYNLPHNQLEEYTKSVHGEALFVKKDLGAPACNDCHGNHGAMPPGINSIARVCGNCHVKNMEFFDASTVSKIFERKGFHGCEQCHSNHAIKKPNDDMLGTGPNSFCIKCHKAGDSGYSSAITMKNYLDNLKKNFESAENKYKEVKLKGMNDIDIGFLLQDAKQNIIQTRTMIHTFDTGKVGKQYSDGMDISKKAVILGDKEIDEYFTRRNGFAIATFIFMILAIALYLKIRDINKNKKNI